MTKVAACALGLILMSGCVTQRSATVMALDGERSIQLKQVTTGFMAGPCTPPLPGRTTEAYWIRLDGDGPAYTTEQLAFVDAKGVVTRAAAVLKGGIYLDRARHTIDVNMYQGETPMSYNGHYKYKGEL